MPEQASESISSENNIADGFMPIEQMVWITSPPVVEPMVFGKHKILPVKFNL